MRAMLVLLGAGSLLVVSGTAQAQFKTAEQMRCGLLPGQSLAACSNRGFASAGTQALPSSERPRAPAPRREAASPVRPGPAASPVATPATAEDHPAGESLHVLFKTGSAELTPDGMRQVNELGKILQSPDAASYRFRVEGHTDTVGARDANRALSARRAEAVVAFLQSRFSVAPGRLEPVGMGQDQPEVQTGDNVAEPRNRRVRVINIGL